MKFRVEVVCISDAGQEHHSNVLEMERGQLAMETLGLNLCESKLLLESVQECVVARQAAEDLERRRRCPDCGDRYTAKGGGKIEVKTLFGAVEVTNPRWNRCACQQGGPKTFRPAAAWLRGTTSPELLYLETKWASLIPFAKLRICCKRCCRRTPTTRRSDGRSRQRPREWRKSWERSGSSTCSTASEWSPKNRSRPMARSRWASTAATYGRRTKKASSK